MTQVTSEHADKALREQLSLINALIKEKQLEVASPRAPAKVRTRMPTTPKWLWLCIRRDINRGMTQQEVDKERARHRRELDDLKKRRAGILHRLGEY